MNLNNLATQNQVWTRGVQRSAQPLAKKTTGQIEKETDELLNVEP